MGTEKKIKTRRGTVVSRSGDKSVRVQIDYKINHPVYGKYIKRRRRLCVHDSANETQVGDVVDIFECSPRSRSRGWRFVN